MRNSFVQFTIFIYYHFDGYYTKTSSIAHYGYDHGDRCHLSSKRQRVLWADGNYTT